MGRQNTQEDLFYSFQLEDHVPADHVLRRIDAVLSFNRARAALAPAQLPLIRRHVKNRAARRSGITNPSPIPKSITELGSGVGVAVIVSAH